MVREYSTRINLIGNKQTILIYNILRDLGLIPTLKGTKLLNKAIQLVLATNNDFVILEEIYKILALNYPNLNSMQIKNLIKYAINTRNEQKSIANFKKIFGFEYDIYYFTNKIIIEEISRVIEDKLTS